MRKRKKLYLAAGALALAGLLAVQLWQPSVATGAWGLSYGSDHTVPRGPADAKELARYHAAYTGDVTQPVIYLTFDAGYENGCTEKILDTLQAHNAPAAFFLVGNYIQKNADLVRRMVEQGHIVGNHTMHHPDMSKLEKQEEFAAELRQLEELFFQTTGKELPRFYRPPQGTYSRINLEHAKALGYKTVFWSLAYVDWRNDAQPTREEAFAKLLPRIHNGAVVLLHSTSRTNAEILDSLLTQWESMGYRFGNLNELFSENMDKST